MTIPEVRVEKKRGVGYRVGQWLGGLLLIGLSVLLLSGIAVVVIALWKWLLL